MKLSIQYLTTMAVLCLGLAWCPAQTPPAAVTVVTPQPTPPTPPEPVDAPEPPVAAPQIAYAAGFGGGDIFLASGGSANRTLVIPRDAADARNLGDIEEDLNVMARILDKAVSGREDRFRNAMGITIHSSIRGPGGAPRNLYLDGYGAVFFLGVNFPLQDTATRGKGDESKDDSNSEWEEARRELSQPAGQGFAFNLPEAGPFTEGPAEAYDAERVEKLKSDLVSSLKNAAHIRRLKPEESVIVVVSGRGPGGETRVVRSRGNRGHAAVAISGHAGPEAAGARLVLRVKKADVEAFQSDKMSLDDFRKLVTMIIY